MCSVCVCVSPYQFSDNGRPERQDVRRREFQQNDTEGQKHFGADHWIAQELEVLGELLCEGKTIINSSSIIIIQGSYSLSLPPHPPPYTLAFTLGYHLVISPLHHKLIH